LAYFKNLDTAFECFYFVFVVSLRVLAALALNCCCCCCVRGHRRALAEKIDI